MFAWNSGPVIAMLAVGGLCWCGFACWELWLSRRQGPREMPPMLPHHIAVQQVVGACIVYAYLLDTRILHVKRLIIYDRTSFLTGLSFTSTVVYLPQRFQAVNALACQVGYQYPAGATRLGIGRYSYRSRARQKEPMLAFYHCRQCVTACSPWFAVFSRDEHYQDSSKCLRLPSYSRLGARNNSQCIFHSGEDRGAA
jgi:hypothetical protein